ncbi:hypothetical protein BDA99DRAFT_533475 [Phascolomyces articulosus]|uniref:Uncharacterized protein n=1 Tax=Phascolomyces articulosus TaxID=60185 RepID=A0AAD5PHM3_9FUNG|nr:hypothetical protein BDA99DRAFT_533475 [Phascolomyces articulosus]
MDGLSQLAHYGPLYVGYNNSPQIWIPFTTKTMQCLSDIYGFDVTKKVFERKEVLVRPNDKIYEVFDTCKVGAWPYRTKKSTTIQTVVNVNDIVSIVWSIESSSNIYCLDVA